MLYVDSSEYKVHMWFFCNPHQWGGTARVNILLIYQLSTTTIRWECEKGIASSWQTNKMQSRLVRGERARYTMLCCWKIIRFKPTPVWALFAVCVFPLCPETCCICQPQALWHACVDAAGHVLFFSTLIAPVIFNHVSKQAHFPVS